MLRSSNEGGFHTAKRVRLDRGIIPRRFRPPWHLYGESPSIPQGILMLRLACLVLSLFGAPSICAGADASVSAPPARSTAVCKTVKPATQTAVADADAEAAPPAAAQNAPVRSPNATVNPRVQGQRWHSLLPGMFR